MARTPTLGGDVQTRLALAQGETPATADSVQAGEQDLIPATVSGAATMYAIRLRDRELMAAVYGDGKMLRGETGAWLLRYAAAQAAAGRGPRGLYAPRPFHVRTYPDYLTSGLYRPVDVDLRDVVTVVVASPGAEVP